jgi:hypothetical protein
LNWRERWECESLRAAFFSGNFPLKSRVVSAILMREDLVGQGWEKGN